MNRFYEEHSFIRSQRLTCLYMGGTGGNCLAFGYEGANFAGLDSRPSITTFITTPKLSDALDLNICCYHCRKQAEVLLRFLMIFSSSTNEENVTDCFERIFKIVLLCHENNIISCVV